MLRKKASASEMPMDPKPKKKFYKKWWFWAIIVIIGIGSIGSGGEDVPDKDVNAKAQEEQPTDDKKKEPKITTIQAIEIDAEIHKVVLASEATAKILTDSMAVVGSEISTFDLYELSKKAKDNHQAFYSQLVNLGDDYNEEYVKRSQYYVLNNKSVAENVIKYIDKDEMKYLSKAKEDIDRTQSHVVTLVSERMKYLSSQGLTDEEVVTAMEVGE